MIVKKFFAILFVFLISVTSSALECSSCSKNIRGQYISHPEKGNFCSRECLAKVMPKCRVCKEPCMEKAVKIRNYIYCSQECMNKSLKCAACSGVLGPGSVARENVNGRKAFYCVKCSKLPGCYFCSMPCRVKPLKDSRRICPRCMKNTVKDRRQIEAMFKEVRKYLAAKFGYDRVHKIELHVVDLKKLTELSMSTYSSEGRRWMALMNYQSKIQTRTYPNGRTEQSVIEENCHIYVLTHCPRELLYDALAHELTHDHVRHHVGVKVKDLALEEGLCELVASIFNRAKGNGFLNRSKKANPDPVYGGGYRKMSEIYKQNRQSFKKTLDYLR